MSNQTGQDEGTVGLLAAWLISVNGGRTEYNNWEIDGGDNMDNGSNGTLNTYPNVDAIAEVKVLTSNYGAQYGRNGSATIETVTKSGTRDFTETFSSSSATKTSTPAISSTDTRRNTGNTISATRSVAPFSFPKIYNTASQQDVLLLF